MAVSTVGGCGQATGQHLRNSPLNEIDPERYLGTIERWLLNDGGGTGQILRQGGQQRPLLIGCIAQEEAFEDGLKTLQGTQQQGIVHIEQRMELFAVGSADIRGMEYQLHLAPSAHSRKASLLHATTVND